jgi:hypothetical protein
MISRGLALTSLFAFVATTQAGVQMQIVPASAGPYMPGQIVNVDVRLQQTPAGGDHLLRLIQVDLNAASNAAFPNIELVSTHPSASVGAINFWDFGSTSACSTPANCGQGHFVDDEKIGPGILGPNLLAIAYYFVNPADLGPNAAAQITLPPGTTVNVGKLRVTMPNAAGNYTLDLINTGNTNPNRGAIVYYGFGLTGGDPVTILRPAPLGTDPNIITGGTHVFTVVPDEEPAMVISSVPACMTSGTAPTFGTLWRGARNRMLINFDKSLPAENPPAGSILIREIVAGGGYAENVTGAFTITVVDNQDGPRRRLRIEQNVGMNIPPGTPNNQADGLPEHRKWYSVEHVGGWTGVSQFKLQHVIQVGDANGDGSVTGLDVSTVNGFLTCFNVDANCPERIRGDVNGDNNVTGLDVSTINGRLTSFQVPKPSGHTCTP